MQYKVAPLLGGMAEEELIVIIRDDRVLINSKVQNIFHILRLNIYQEIDQIMLICFINLK